jgi:hypothetical protein
MGLAARAAMQKQLGFLGPLQIVTVIDDAGADLCAGGLADERQYSDRWFFSHGSEWTLFQSLNHDLSQIERHGELAILRMVTTLTRCLSDGWHPARIGSCIGTYHNTAAGFGTVFNHKGVFLISSGPA